jgi:ketosteroid isomerase-like protein
MTEAQNIERIGKIYEAFGRGDVAYIVDQVADDVRWVAHFEPVVPWGGDYSGKARVPRFFEAIRANAEITAFNPLEFIASGDTVVSIGELDAKVPATGKSSRTRWVFVWKLRDEKVVSYEQFHSPELAEAFR